ncbi:hypothetical protein pb186bvf_006240 [Paramecium bursaria]
MDDLKESYLNFVKQKNPDEFYQLFDDRFAIDFASQTLIKQIMKQVPKIIHFQSEEDKKKCDKKKEIREFIKEEIHAHNNKQRMYKSENHRHLLIDEMLRFSKENKFQVPLMGKKSKHARKHKHDQFSQSRKRKH